MTLHDAIKNGIGDRRIPDSGAPVFNRQLAGHDRGTTGGTVVNDLQQIRVGGVIDGAHPSVIQHQHVGLRQLHEPLAEHAAAVPACVSCSSRLVARPSIFRARNCARVVCIIMIEILIGSSWGRALGHGRD